MRYLPPLLLAALSVQSVAADDLYKDYYRYKQQQAPAKAAYKVRKSTPVKAAEPETPVESRVNFLVELGAGYLNSGDMEGFYVHNGYVSETITGTGSLNGQLRVGIGWEYGAMRFDLLGGGGFLSNSALDATLLSGEAALYYMFDNDWVALGAHLQYMGLLSPKADNDNHLGMDDASAIAPGIVLTLGGKTVMFKGSLDYVSGMKIGVSGKNGYAPSASQISMDGVMLQLGLLMRF